MASDEAVNRAEKAGRWLERMTGRRGSGTVKVIKK